MILNNDLHCMHCYCIVYVIRDVYGISLKMIIIIIIIYTIYVDTCTYSKYLLAVTLHVQVVHVGHKFLSLLCL